MSEAQKKAQELIKMFRPFVDSNYGFSKETEEHNARQCAILHVDGIIEVYNDIDEDYRPNLLIRFYESVKAELTKQ